MPVVKPQGLRGLRGLGGLSKAQYDDFINKNRDLIAQHGKDPVYINNLYSNKQFIDKYGIDAFKAMPDIKMRNTLYKDDIVNTEFTKLYSPFNADGTRDNKKGLGADFEKYNQLSTDAKLKLMESDYLSPSEFESNWQKRMKESAIERSGTGNSPSKTLAMGAGVSLMRSIASLTSAISKGNGLSEAMGLFTPGGEESAKKISLDKNQKILDNIYNDDVDAAAKRFGSEVGKAYSDISIAGLSDKQVKEAFVQAVTPDRYTGNLGVSEFASHLGSSEMEDFSIDEMRQVLAKKKVYDAYMSPDMAATALNNDAKRYITDHQGRLKRFGLFMKDVGISTMSYSADKLNGISEIYRAGQDAFMDKPIVMVDDKGEILDPNKTHVIKDKHGNLRYQDSEGQIHSIHKMQVDYTTLHAMGKNPDGSNIEGAFGIDWMTLNPQYWTRAEQFGTLDKDEQKQYERLGSSPYKVSYNPNEDSDIWYESFKMMSFGLADAGSQLVPFGIGFLGRTLSAADKVGKVAKIAKGFGKVLDTTGKMLTAETKVGQVAQGTAGALGIAYAYDRGAFQETLQQNLANAEEALLTTAKNDIYNKYNNDKQYKATIDKAINQRAAALKQDYLARVQKDGGMQIADMNAVDKMLHSKAQAEVLQGVVQNEINRRRDSKEYADLQQEAINSAGDAAFNTFFPEAIKYGFVNNLGYRKFLYTNPSGLTKKMSSSLKGLKEITTSAGRKRLATDASKFLTRADKWKEFGKTVGSQAWGGAWTNGTDDMQVDAAERINEDSFNRYLNAYQTGEALADTYGFADGLYSYMKGLQNSMGQETTWNAATVGALGSIVNFTPNFVNIARLATKEGRQAYKDNFRRKIERDDDGIPLRNDDGSIQYKDLSKWNDWRGQINYFIQNGVLNTYYGKKQAERDLQSHADYVNNILDEYNDFKDIEDLVASNIASQNLENEGDRKTMSFIKALHAVNALENLGNSSKDPATMSSVVQNAKTLIDKASQLNLEEGKSPFSEKEISNLLSQYYANNPGVEQSEENSQKALYTIAQNAQKLKEASDAFNAAEKEIQKIEKNRGESIDYAVRTKMKMQQALNGHWLERKEQMQSELDDSSSDDNTSDAITTIAAIGGTKNAQSLSKVYDKQYKELSEEIKKQKEKAVALDKEYTKTVEEVKAAQEAGNSDAVLEAQKKQKEAKAKWEAADAQVNYLETMQSMTREKNSKLSNSLASLASDDFKDPKDKILTADEIFSLDPVTRARMMREENRSLYSEEQQREIEKLEQRLLMKDADALQKIQDIALLSQRIEANKDAYSRMAKNPEAAAFALETQRMQAAEAAYRLINQRNAETAAEYINQFDEAMKGHSDVPEEAKQQYVYKLLRKLNPNLLNTIAEDSLLPQYQKQVYDAKDWGKTVSDIAAVIAQSDKDDAWKDNALRNIDSIVENANTKDDIIKSLEKVVDDIDNSEAAEDINYILNGLENLGYQRDATVVENRKQRKQREAEAKQKQEEAQKKVEEAAKKEAEKKVQAESKAAAEKKSKENVPTKEGRIEGTEEDVPLGIFDEEISGDATKKDSSTDEAKGKEDKGSKEDDKGSEGKGTSTEEGDQQGEGNQQGEGKPDAEGTEKSNTIIDNGDTIQTKSETIDEQAADITSTTDEGKDVVVSDINEDADAQNARGQKTIDGDPTTLSGNAMSRYEPKPLAEDGILVNKKGKDTRKAMDNYFAWMDAAGIKLQNIIDHELARIIARNPHAKVKFMAVRMDENATHDDHMKNHLMMVLDYDNSINKGITAIHDDANGGVIESNGKKYLVIGTAGYGNMNKSKQALYNILFGKTQNQGIGLITSSRVKFFKEHPNERFYVNDDITTEVVPYSQIPGFIVRQLPTDANPTYRSVKELLADKNRNPLGYTLDTVPWGIQEISKFMLVGTTIDKAMVPRNPFRNNGSAFVLMPACNGKLFPAYLKPLMYKEMRDGSLKERVNTLIQELIAPNYDRRYQAVKELGKIFYFDKTSKNILVGTDTGRHKNEISFVQGDRVLKTFVLNNDFDRGAFWQAFEDMNPRVNITAQVLRSPNLLEEYSEAGALDTDAALFGAAGSSYSVYGVDHSGNMIMPKETTNPPKTDNSDFKDSRLQIPFMQEYYRLADGVFYLNGKAVTDEAKIKQLQYNKDILEKELSPAETKGIWEYFILSEGEPPSVLKRNKNDYTVKELPEEEAKELIKKIEEQKAKKAREEAAKGANDASDKANILQTQEDVPLDNGLGIDPVTGEMTAPETSLEDNTSKDDTPVGEESKEGEGATVDKHIGGILPGKSKEGTQKFTDLFNSRKYKRQISTIIRGKWKDTPTDMNALEKFLRDKDIEVDSIGTTKEDIDAWIKTLEDCR